MLEWWVLQQCVWILEQPIEEHGFLWQISSVQSLDQVGHWGDMKDEFQDFVKCTAIKKKRKEKKKDLLSSFFALTFSFFSLINATITSNTTTMINTIIIFIITTSKCSDGS